ncbi:MAG: hypothetical protein IJL48_04865 [Bacteroidales bacterium]|nr:hypothetical protein [Bacteroidales bacterium]
MVIKEGLLFEFLKYMVNRCYCLLIPDYRSFSVEKRVKKMLDSYEEKFGYRMDINHPKTYTEKIQWYKAFYTGDGHLDRIVDKHQFKQYVKEKVGEGHTIPIIGVWTDVRSMEKDWADLPEEFCLKSNVKDQGRFIDIIHNKSEVDFKKKKWEWSQWLLPKWTLINSFAVAYYNCIPKIIAEQYVENVKNQLFDYKVMCFDGQPFCIEAAKERFGSNGPSFTFYDLEWNKLDVTSGHHPNEDIPHPNHLDEMLEIAKILSKDFPHVRVDFFDTDDKLYVAEMTFFTGGGYSYYEPQSFNVQMGELFKLPIESQEV